VIVPAISASPNSMTRRPPSVQPFCNVFSATTLRSKPTDLTVFPFNTAQFVHSKQYMQGNAFLKPLTTPIVYTHDTVQTYEPTVENQQEFLLVGRSNVGKSSLLNALTGQNAAVTSKTPVGLM